LVLKPHDTTDATKDVVSLRGQGDSLGDLSGELLQLLDVEKPAPNVSGLRQNSPFAREDQHGRPRDVGVPENQRAQQRDGRSRL
jgi:hypothetical protein